MTSAEKSYIDSVEDTSTEVPRAANNTIPDTFDGLSDEEYRALEKKLVWKIDLHLITSLFGIFIFNILDRSNIASARLGGLQTDLHLTDTQYQTAVSIMFVGYLLGQIPSNLILTKLNPSRYLPIAIIVWGGISLATAGVKNFSGIFAVRFLIGFAESPFFAGALLLISSWYKPSEIAPRVALMYCGNTIANGFGGVLAAGVLSGLEGKGGFEGWRWLYIIEGAGTMVVGLVAFLLLPDFPRSGKKKWLTEQEQRLAEYRIAISANGELDETSTAKQGLIDTVTDIKVWGLVAVQVCLLSSQTWTYFFPSIVQTLGYGKIRSLLLTSPVYVFGFFTSLGNSLIAARTGKRAILVMWPLALAIVGNGMVIGSHATAVRYTGMFLMCAGSFSAFNVLEAWVGSTIPRTRTKRAITYALVNMLGNLSNIYGSYFFPSNTAPQYVAGGIALSSFAFGGICFAAVLGLYLRRENRKAAEAEDRDGVIRYKYLI
ncbi:probable permease of the major facilitator superfamily [Phialocephala subalpina]|uniref:Probable permease of the major facilitator superfamily n=1 Tax=Phialocephala subalpina TaxID=576137 RepID=A0A1L7WHV2_9HELO|nr:probable permease of the major facilitator superfamily [Phialocephala subalpina]